jgi:hypothetical protein
MSAEQIGGLLRALLATGGTYAIAKGYVTPENWEWISAGALGLVVSGWSWWAKKPAK